MEDDGRCLSGGNVQGIAREEAMLKKIAAGTSTVELLGLPPLAEIT